MERIITGVFGFALLGLVLLSFYACEDDNPSPFGDENVFLALHLDGSNIGPDSYFSLMTINNGTAEFERLQDVFPSGTRHNWLNRVDAANGVVGISLHDDLCPATLSGMLTPRRGFWFDISSAEGDTLPVLPPNSPWGISNTANRYSLMDETSIQVSESGHVFYLSGSHEYHWVDSYREAMVRYDINNGELKKAESPKSFVLGQEDVGSQYDFYKFQKPIYPSKDGRYVYGAVQAYGTSGGQLIWGPKILFEYDYNASSYRRLGDTGETGVTVYGITADRSQLLYFGSGERKRINLGTGQTTVLNNISGSYLNRACWNNSGFVRGSNSKAIRYDNIMEDVQLEIPAPANTSAPQFSADGSRVYYHFSSSSKNYLLVTSDLSTDAVTDTVAVLPDNVRIMVLR